MTLYEQMAFQLYYFSKVFVRLRLIQHEQAVHVWVVLKSVPVCPRIKHMFQCEKYVYEITNFCNLTFMLHAISLVPRRYVLFYGLRGLCVGRVDQFDRFRCEAPGRIRFDFWSGLRFLERTQ